MPFVFGLLADFALSPFHATPIHLAHQDASVEEDHSPILTNAEKPYLHKDSRDKSCYLSCPAGCKDIRNSPQIPTHRRPSTQLLGYAVIQWLSWMNVDSKISQDRGQEHYCTSWQTRSSALQSLADTGASKERGKILLSGKL